MKKEQMPDGSLLLRIARGEIERGLGLAAPLEDEDKSWLNERGATFVTLTLKNELRGCIGSLEADTSLLEDLKKNARAAAFHDPRFRPVSAEELVRLRVEVSVLGPLCEMKFRNEEDAKSLMHPDVDGIVFAVGERRSTFLPQVWEKLPDRTDFLSQLKIKAGYSPDFWSGEVKLFRYGLTKWSEPEAEARG